jgi:hypothetical protein
MIVNASASEKDYDETVTTLKYGALAREVVCREPQPSGGVNNNGSRGADLLAAASRYTADGRKVRAGSDNNAKKRARTSSKWASSRTSTTSRGGSKMDDSDNKQSMLPPLSEVKDNNAGPERGVVEYGNGEDEEEELGLTRIDVQMLREENDQLRTTLLAAEEKCCELEAEVRAEVAEEMQERLAAMEEMYAEQFRSNAQAQEESYRAKTQIAVKRIVGGDVASQEVEELVEQVHECEEEMVSAIYYHRYDY